MLYLWSREETESATARVVAAEAPGTNQELRCANFDTRDSLRLCLREEEDEETRKAPREEWKVVCEIQLQLVRVHEARIELDKVSKGVDGDSLSDGGEGAATLRGDGEGEAVGGATRGVGD